MHVIGLMVVQVPHVGESTFQIPQKFCEKTEEVYAFLGIAHVEFLGPA